MAGGSDLSFGNLGEDVVGDGDLVRINVDDFAIAHEDHGDVSGAVFEDGAVESSS